MPAFTGGEGVGGQVNNPSYLEGPQERSAGTGLRGWSYPTCRTLSTTRRKPRNKHAVTSYNNPHKILLYTY